MKNILVATDGSRPADKAVAFAADLARRFDAELTVTHVATPERISAEDRHLIETEYAAELAQRVKGIQPGATIDVEEYAPSTSLQEQATAVIHDLLGERLLESIETTLHEKGPIRVSCVLRHGDPAREILTLADEIDADLIVLASRGLGEMQALLLGSISNKVAHMARHSVVLVR